MVEEILNRLEHEGAETAALLIGVLKPIALQNHDKEVLSEILGFLGRVALPAHKREYWPPVDSAKLGQRLTRHLRIRVGCGQNQAPARGSKHARLG